MHDLRQHVDTLSAPHRLAEVRKLTQDVSSLYRQLAEAF
jgi:hypothetical protein